MDLTTNYPVPGDLTLKAGEASIITVLRERARLHPHKRVFTFLGDGETETETATFAELDSEALRIASLLSEAGMKEKNLLLFYPPGIAFISAFFGCLYSGAVPVPAYPPRKNRSLERIRLMASDCGAAAILATEEITRSLERNFSDDPGLSSLPWISSDKKNKASAGFKVQEPDTARLAFLQYTSGSTGNPKGVMVSHRNIMANLRSLQLHMQIRPDDNNVHWVPQFHDLGLILGILEAIFSGSHSIIIPPVVFISNPLTLLRAISRYRARLSGGPDFSFNHCADKIHPEQLSGIDLSSLKVMFSGAEPVRAETIDRFTRAFESCGFTRQMFFPAYGMAETTLIQTGTVLGSGPDFKAVSAAALLDNRIEAPSGKDDIRYVAGNGKPNMDTRILIVNPSTLEVYRENEVGEIWVSGNTVCMGYWGKQELTAETFNVSPAGVYEPVWMRTGDLGFSTPEGFFVTGRLKNLIIINGKNYYPQDIELSAEVSHPSIRKTFVAAIPIEYNNKERLAVVAEIERTALRDKTHSLVIDAIASAISSDHELQAARIVLVRTNSIPKTSSGKMMHREVRSLLLSGKLDVIAERYFSDEDIESVLTEESGGISALISGWISAKLNNGLPVDINLTPGVYGLDSLRAVELSDVLKKNYGIEFPAYRMFEDLTIKQLIAEAENLFLIKPEDNNFR